MNPDPEDLMMNRTAIFPTGLTFDDVLLVPRRTAATSRSLIDLSSQLTPRIRLHVPIVSANTPWCTEAAMAIAMARNGGIGFLHRMCPPEHQAEQLCRVKSAPCDASEFPHATKDKEGRLLVGAAIGVQGDYPARAELLVREGVDILVIDIAHGHADYALQTIELIKSRFPWLELVAGNIATGEAARDLISAGADVLKVGVGPGSVCTTRIVTGCGVPQLTAILDCVDVARPHGIPVIADGGIRSSGDMTKALAAGASTIMLGSLLAGTEESAAAPTEVDGVKYKISTGFVTLGVKLTLKRLSNLEVTREELKRYTPEGTEATFRYTGTVAETLTQYANGMRSGFSYCGSMSTTELWERAAFMQVSPAAHAEGKPHALTAVRQVHPDYSNLLVD
ncbi:IMP dehydrogenase [Cystobacter fuscus]